MTKAMRAGFPSFAPHFLIFCLLGYLILVTAPRKIVAQSMSAPRTAATATELNDGRILIAGGDGGSGPQASADLYTAAAGGKPAAFVPTGPMTTVRSFHTASLLRDGRVLLTGGLDGNAYPLASAEIYDPATGKFAATGSMSTARVWHQAAVLPDGRVLVAGGMNDTSAEIYNPATGKFTATGSMSTIRYYSAMVVLNNGKVLVAGGSDNHDVASAEIYDPATGKFTPTGAMNTARAHFTLTLLNGGQVLAAGSDNPSRSAEIYDPETGVFTNTSGDMSEVRWDHTATLLTNGQVLVAGGSSTDNSSTTSTEKYDPVTGTFSPGPGLRTSRYGHTATPLTGGGVLMAGGGNATADIYSTSVTVPPGLSSIAVNLAGSARMGSAVTLSYRATGTFSGGATQALQGVVWSTANPQVAVISNDETDRGVALVLAPSGTTTVQACAGTVCGYGSTLVEPQLTTPTPGTTLSGSMVTFTWTGGVGPAAYALKLGTTGTGSSDLYNGSPTTATSASLSSIPTNGVTLYSRLMYQVNGTWYSIDYTYTEAGTSTLPALTSPVPGSTLSGPSATFTWSPGAGPTAYQLLLATNEVGLSNVYNGSATNSTSAAVSGIPTNGVKLYARLLYKLSGAWKSIDYTYTEAGTPTLPALTSPVPGSTLSGPSATFTWSPGAGPSAYQLLLATTGVGASNVYSGGGTTSTSAAVSGIPTNGVKLYARLLYKLSGAWKSIDYTYTESGTPTLPALTSPVPGSTLSGPSATFTWSPGAGPTAYQLLLATNEVGLSNVYSGSATSSTSAAVSGIPTNGVKLYARLLYKLSGAWKSIDYTYTEAGTSTLPALISPVPGSTLSGSSATFTWSPGAGPSAYQLVLGTTDVGSSNVYSAFGTTSTSAAVSGIPTNGVKLYARLLYKLSGAWKSIDYTYTESGTPTLPALTSPVPGSTLSGSSATFTWSPGAGPTAYKLWLGAFRQEGSEVFEGGETTGISAAVSGIPTNGATLYATLGYKLNGTWYALFYTYTEAGTPTLPALTSPVPGSTLLGPSARFTWSPGAGPTDYKLWLGTTGVGSSDVYDDFYRDRWMHTTSATVNYIPTSSAKLYARLLYKLSGEWKFTDYTYTEADASTPPAITSPVPGSTLGSSATFTWRRGAGFSSYRLVLGTTGVGSMNVYSGSYTTSTSVAVSGIPTDGVTLYAELQCIGEGYYSIDYTYTEPGTPTPPALTSPVPGSTLTGPTVTFTWSRGAGPTAYKFSLGTTGVGSGDLYHSNVHDDITSTSALVSGIPTRGAKLYARLLYELSGAWKSIDYTYTEAAPATQPALTSPVPGSTLSGSSATFTWSPGVGVLYYVFLLGTTGVGSSNVYNSASVSTTSTSVAVSGIPTNGAKLYATLGYVLNVWFESINYTYTEAGAPALTSPVPGSTLSGPSATFTWSPGPEPRLTAYHLLLGTTGKGAPDVFDGGATTGISSTVLNVPTNYVTHYAWLNYKLSGAYERQREIT